MRTEPHITRARPLVRYDHPRGAANLAITISASSVVTAVDRLHPRTVGESDRDERNTIISWRAVPGVVGYNLRWGISPSKLYQTYQRFADEETTLELRALTIGQPYWVAIESFDENGVSTLSAPVPIR
jgi:hypothetical protein